MSDEVRVHLRQLGTLWHYTGVTGLLGIVQSHALWATDAEFLNDGEELLHADRLLQTAWDEADTDLRHGGTDFDGNRLHRILGRFRAGQPVKVVATDEPAPYVISFCLSGDKLSQWRGYGGGEAYAVGFPAVALADAAIAVGGDLCPVYYADPHNIPNVPGYPDDDGVLWLHARERAQIKDPGFIEEDEYRIIIPGTTDLRRNHRPGAQGLTPYVEVSLATSPPERVMIGPGGGPARRKAVLSLLEANGWGGVEVESSSIPLR